MSNRLVALAGSIAVTLAASMASAPGAAAGRTNNDEELGVSFVLPDGFAGNPTNIPSGQNGKAFRNGKQLSTVHPSDTEIDRFTTASPQDETACWLIDCVRRLSTVARSPAAGPTLGMDVRSQLPPVTAAGLA
jgi:hypothetical protein